jgi:hypothetical protein
LIVELIKLNFTDVNIQTVKTNLNNYINNLKSEFSSGIFSSMQELTTQEENMVQYFRQVNLVNTKTDGLITDKGVPRVYNLSGTTEVNKPSSGQLSDTNVEMWGDYQDMGNKLISFDELMKDSNVTIIPPSLNVTEPGDFILRKSQTFFVSIENKRMFMVLARIFSDKNKLTDFENKIISGDLKNVKDPYNLSNKFNKICNNFLDMVNTELKAEEKFYIDFKKSKGYKPFITQDVYNKGKLRKFNYTTVPNPSTNTKQSSDVLNLYKNNTNNQDKQTWTDKVKFN